MKTQKESPCPPLPKSETAKWPDLRMLTCAGTPSVIAGGWHEWKPARLPRGRPSGFAACHSAISGRLGIAKGNSA